MPLLPRAARLGAAGALLALAAPAAAQIPDGAVFATSEVYCDCDPTEFAFRTRHAVPARAAPRRDARVLRTVAAGRWIEGNDWTEARTVVPLPATVVLTAPVTLTALRRTPARRDADGLWRPVWDRGADVPSLALPAGTRVRLYTGEAGGAWLATPDGLLYYADDAWAVVAAEGPGATARAEGPPAVEQLWLRLRARAGQPAAWVEIDADGGADTAVEMVCSTHVECPPGDLPPSRRR